MPPNVCFAIIYDFSSMKPFVRSNKYTKGLLLPVSDGVGGNGVRSFVVQAMQHSIHKAAAGTFLAGWLVAQR